MKAIARSSVSSECSHLDDLVKDWTPSVYQHLVLVLNNFIWPGPDFHSVPGVKPFRFDYGMLPPRFFAHIRDSVLQKLTAIAVSIGFRARNSKYQCLLRSFALSASDRLRCSQ